MQLDVLVRMLIGILVSLNRTVLSSTMTITVLFPP